MDAKAPKLNCGAALSCLWVGLFFLLRIKDYLRAAYVVQDSVCRYQSVRALCLGKKSSSVSVCAAL